MTHHQIFKTRLYLATERGYSEVVPISSNIHVGIWWHDKSQVLGFGCSLATFPEPKGLVDSDLSHSDAWEMARRQLSYPSNIEYFSIPRGRILWHTEMEMGILYHGNATTERIQRILAKLFGLPKWKAGLDPHYLTGTAADAFFNDE